MRIAVVFNARSGTAANAAAGAGLKSTSPEARCAELSQLFQAAGVQAAVCPLEGDSLERDVRQALSERVDAVVAAGGDGTVNAVSSMLAGTDVALGVLPLGTLNHFAKDAGIPLPLDEAIRVIAAGRTRQLD